MLHQKPKVLTRQAYLDALSARIDRLVVAEAPARARALLEIVEREERLLAADGPLEGVGQLLAENSDRLSEACGWRLQAVENPQHDPDLVEALECETLEDFLWALYPPERDDW